MRTQSCCLLPAANPSSNAPAVYRILGVDPGTTVLGYAIIEVHNKSLRVVELGTLKLHKFEEHAERLQRIFERMGQLIQQYQPRAMAIEAPFYGKNPQSMLKLGRAQGVAMAAAMTHGLTVEEYAPRKIKQSITGKGSASKEQVAAMLAQQFQLDASRYLHDATDALATAVCHYYQQNSFAGAGKRYSGWENFITNNQSRVTKPS